MKAAGAVESSIEFHLFYPVIQFVQVMLLGHNLMKQKIMYYQYIIFSMLTFANTCISLPMTKCNVKNNTQSDVAWNHMFLISSSQRFCQPGSWKPHLMRITYISIHTPYCKNDWGFCNTSARWSPVGLYHKGCCVSNPRVLSNLAIDF